MQFGEPSPKSSDSPSMHDLVIEDMEARKQFGLNKYGTILQANNGRDALKDAYEEVLDLAVYLRQKLYEQEQKQAEFIKTLTDLKRLEDEKAQPMPEGGWNE